MKNFFKAILFLALSLVSVSVGAIATWWGGTVMREAPSDSLIPGVIQVVKFIGLIGGIAVILICPFLCYELFYKEK